MLMGDWIILDRYRSQSEARVVESFLRAKGLESQVLDTHTIGFLPTTKRGVGIRLLVRAEDEAQARQLLKEAASTSHLSIVVDESETPPPIFSRRDRIVVALLMILALLVWWRSS